MSLFFFCAFFAGAGLLRGGDGFFLGFALDLGFGFGLGLALDFGFDLALDLGLAVRGDVALGFGFGSGFEFQASGRVGFSVSGSGCLG